MLAFREILRILGDLRVSLRRKRGVSANRGRTENLEALSDSRRKD
jgi:hypothetical protein